MFLEFKELMNRPRIRKELEAEGKVLMNSIKSWLTDVKQTLSTKSITDSHQAETSEEPLKEIDVIRVLETQV